MKLGCSPCYTILLITTLLTYALGSPVDYFDVSASSNLNAALYVADPSLGSFWTPSTSSFSSQQLTASFSSPQVISNTTWIVSVPVGNAGFYEVSLIDTSGQLAGFTACYGNCSSSGQSLIALGGVAVQSIRINFVGVNSLTTQYLANPSQSLLNQRNAAINGIAVYSLLAYSTCEVGHLYSFQDDTCNATCGITPDPMQFQNIPSLNMNNVKLSANGIMSISFTWGTVDTRVITATRIQGTQDCTPAIILPWDESTQNNTCGIELAAKYGWNQLFQSCPDNLRFYQTASSASVWMLLHLEFIEDIWVDNGARKAAVVPKGYLSRDYTAEYSLGVVAPRVVTLATTLNISLCDGIVCPAIDQCHGIGSCDPLTGFCIDGPALSAITCDDNSLCTLNDVCTNGVCSGTPVSCSALDQCHDAGVCDPQSGQCTNPDSVDGKTCSDGILCTGSDACNAGVCIGQPVVCQPLDACHDVGVCNNSTGLCSNPFVVNGKTCDDNNKCTQYDACQAGVCVGTNPVVCQGDQCNDGGVCNPQTGTCNITPKPNQTPCDDSNLCTQTDVCNNGVCIGGNNTVCHALDQCHEVGFCNPSTGQCSNPLSTNGKACNDSNLCTRSDQCFNGYCNGTTISCSVQDQCHEAGVCNPANGLCSNPTSINGKPCNDSNAYTVSDQCHDGLCNGTVVVCPSRDCHGPGSYNPVSGQCEYSRLANGTSCSDGNYCTYDDQCQAGVCTGVSVTCPASDQCHEVGVCNPSTGICSDPVSTNGKTCSDNNLCSQTDTCQAGICVGNNFTVCHALDQCHEAGVCQPSTGQCSSPISINGKSCNDNNLCTQIDACYDGVCQGSSPVICVAIDQCHEVGICEPSTGQCCNNVTKPDGNSCSDGNQCTRTDVCSNGVCVGSNPVICSASDQCHEVGVCNSATGQCSNPVSNSTKTCNDNDFCTYNDHCSNGLCAGTPVTCTALDQCHSAGVCDPSNGFCTNPTKSNGTTCNDNNLCTSSDTCKGGICSGVTTVTCSAQDQCHDVGVCNPSTGTCSNPISVNGKACNDSDSCSQTDTCQHGVCVGTNPISCPFYPGCNGTGICDPNSGHCDAPCSLCNNTICNNPPPCHTGGVCDILTGLCTYTPVANGTSCDDSNLCTSNDVCSAGVCAGTSSVTCSAADQCHNTGVCDPQTGLCSNPRKENGTVCNDNNLCTQSDACYSGVCVGSNPIKCSALDQCHEIGQCEASTGLCSNPISNNTKSCNDNDACTQNDVCNQGLCVGYDPVICAASDQCHEDGVCNSATGQCSNPVSNNGKSCADGSLCTLGDYCSAGVCVSGSPLNCTALDVCHEIGVCDPATGTCSTPYSADGKTCSDNNLCTQTDTCQSGVCVGNPVSCAFLDSCHGLGECVPSTGSCYYPTYADGTFCSDDNECTSRDQCHSGVCIGQDPVVCQPFDQCYDAGLCHPVTGCSNPFSVAGTPCNDTDLYTINDQCHNGTCHGTPVECSPLDDCHEVGVYNPVTQQCEYTQKANGTSCNDSDLCTYADQCQSGVCIGTPVTCSPSDQCHDAGVCDSSSGSCTNPQKTNGTSCNDQDLCTQTDTCQAGSCVGTNPITCSASDQCHEPGTCDPYTGQCSDPNSINGKSCNDQDLCTQTDTCSDGVCIGSNPVACSALDQCHVAGVCNPASGQCSNPHAPNGTSCDDQNLCTQTDQCEFGVCAGLNPVVCSGSDQCHADGICDPATGQCNDPPKPNGSPCSDNNACTLQDTCQAGICVSSSSVLCSALDQCHDVGVCNPNSGVCSDPIKPNGVACSNTDLCSQTDSCQNGVCVGSNNIVCPTVPSCNLAGVCVPVNGSCTDPCPPRVTGAIISGSVTNTRPFEIKFATFTNKFATLENGELKSAPYEGNSSLSSNATPNQLFGNTTTQIWSFKFSPINTCVLDGDYIFSFDMVGWPGLKPTLTFRFSSQDFCGQVTNTSLAGEIELYGDAEYLDISSTFAFNDTAFLWIRVQTAFLVQQVDVISAEINDVPSFSRLSLQTQTPNGVRFTIPVTEGLFKLDANTLVFSVRVTYISPGGGKKTTTVSGQSQNVLNLSALASVAIPASPSPSPLPGATSGQISGDGLVDGGGDGGSQSSPIILYAIAAGSGVALTVLIAIVIVLIRKRRQNQRARARSILHQ